MTIDDYEKGDLIGAGGFADVYRATHLPTRRAVALKTSRADDESRARIRREIEVQRKLHHANVLEIVDWDREELAWFTTEIAEGNLGEIHDKERLTESGVVRLLEEILGALGAAHRRGHVHRDLSPGNILRTHGRWVLADWGYVSDPAASKVGRVTRTGTRGGTFQWSSPEMLQDAHRADARSDLFALGKLAAWLLTGQPPVAGERPELPGAPHWTAFLGRMVELDAAERFQTAEEALTSLRDVVAALHADDERRVEGAPDRSSAHDSPGLPAVAALKRYIVDDQHRVRLSELMKNETEAAIVRVLGQRFNANTVDRGDAILDRLQAYVESCKTLMHLVFNGCYYGREQHEGLWTTCVQRMVNTYEQRGGIVALNELQRTPGALVMSAGALGAVLGDNYSNLAAVTVRPMYRRDGQDDLPVVARFGVSSVLGGDIVRTTTRFKNHKTPGSELMFEYLRELGRSVLVSDAEYEERFDEFEVLMVLLSMDANAWATGRFAWKDFAWSEDGERGAVGRVHKRFAAAGSAWAPLKVGLFGGEVDRVTGAFKRLVEIAQAVARR